MAGLEERMAKLEATTEQVDRRLNHVETALEGIRTEISNLRRDLTTKIDSQFKWILGFIVMTWAIFGGLIGVLISIVLKQ